MVIGFTGSIQWIRMQGNGVMGKAMVLEYKLAPMEAVILGKFKCGVKHGLGCYQFWPSPLNIDEDEDSILNGDGEEGEIF
ncbi:hypothetical protein FEM48_Zijuj01G0183100 [Ziziphus jujuba var. spinosa]|uniref:Uncharacterized protein n=1 Tax=Ziziphus jujuba var. spinosa TaxID=714518 RepID=A0A978W2U2_ZIZJJ|nr:hypothetical protein FEM48_Zijuj01G0183100 [Ziziphus jujuba var. spinosa]